MIILGFHFVWVSVMAGGLMVLNFIYFIDMEVQFIKGQGVAKKGLKNMTTNSKPLSSQGDH